MANPSQLQPITFAYDFKDLTFYYDAHITSDSPYLRLIKTDNSGKAANYSQGAVVYTPKDPFWRPETIKTTIKFIITPNDSSDQYTTYGIAFFIAPVGTTIPPGSGGRNFGIFGPNGYSPDVIALVFNTYSRQIEIVIDGNLVSTIPIPDSYIGKEVTLDFNYEASTNVIIVVVTWENYEKTMRAGVKDLKGILEQGVQVAIFAATGDQHVANHDVVSWHFTSDGGENYT